MIKYLLVSIITILATIFSFSAIQKYSVEKFHWRIQSQAPSNNPDYQSLLLFVKKIKTMSSGRFIITPYPAGEKSIVSGGKIFNAVKENEIEMGLGWPNWWIKHNPGWAAVQSGPFGFMNLDASMMYFFSGEGTKLANELANPEGVLWRPAWWAGMEFGIFTTTEIKRLADLQGKNIRIGPGIPSDVLTEAAGTNSIPTTPEKINILLKSNLLDGVEWTVPSASWNMNFHEYAKYVIAPAIWQPSVLGDFLINKSAYDKLPQDLRTILETAMRESMSLS